MKTVYAGNASTTQIRQEVLDVMNECSQHYGNPSCTHSIGQKAKEIVDNARNQIAQSIGAKDGEIVFASGGTEANNLAIQGYAFDAYENGKGNHIITVSTEHVSVINPCRYLQRCGFDVTYLPVDGNGLIDLRRLQRSIHRDTILISVMYANNEIGTLQPIKAIGKIAREYGVCFHTDAVQAYGHYNIDVNDLGIDMMPVSGHKIYAPKGVGALYIKEDINLIPLFHGGGQEYGLRSGTENVVSIAGFGKAAELLNKSEKEQIERHLLALKIKLIAGMKNIPDVKINGSIENSLPGLVNVSFDDADGKTLAAMLDSKGICVSTGSACSTGSMNASHVLKAIGLPNDLARSSIRFSFGMYNTENDVDYILDVLPDVVYEARQNIKE